jgi:hypothetical protein
VLKDALDLNGQTLASIVPGGEFLYSIRVDNPVTPAVAVQLTDTFAAEVRPVTIVSTQNGSCGLNAQTLTCTMTPSADQIATVVVRVRVVAQAGATINNSATATLASGTSAVGNARVVLVTTGNPTAVPVTPVVPTPQTPVVPTPRTPGPTTPPRTTVPTSRPPQPTSRPTAVPTTRPGQPTAVPTTRPGQPTRQPTVAPTRPPAGSGNQQATARPNNPQPTARPQGPTNTPAPTATPGPTLPPVTTPAPGQPSIRFNLKSDWGQVFVGDTFEYVITLQNVGQEAGGSSPMMSQSRSSSKVEAMRNIAPLNNVVISDDINAAFEIVDATGDGLTVKTTGQKVEATRAVLARRRRGQSHDQGSCAAHRRPARHAQQSGDAALHRPADQCLLEHCRHYGCRQERADCNRRADQPADQHAGDWHELGWWWYAAVRSAAGTAGGAGHGSAEYQWWHPALRLRAAGPDPAAAQHSRPSVSRAHLAPSIDGKIRTG